MGVIYSLPTKLLLRVATLILGEVDDNSVVYVHFFVPINSHCFVVYTCCYQCWNSSLPYAILHAANFLFSVDLGAQAWVEGVKDVIEPLIILLLAWALGAVIQVGVASIGHTLC